VDYNGSHFYWSHVSRYIVLLDEIEKRKDKRKDCGKKGIDRNRDINREKRLE
jgi:hypothetical protein